MPRCEENRTRSQPSLIILPSSIRFNSPVVKSASEPGSRRRVGKTACIGVPNIPVYPAHKRIRSKKSNRPGQEPVHRARHEAITEEEHARHEAVDVQTGEIVPHAIGKYPDRATTAYEKGLPPPLVILRAVSAEILQGEMG